MRFPEGLFIDVERTLGELKFAALRRESFAQDEEGNVTDEVIKRTYDLKCQRQGRTITVSIPPEAGEKCFQYNAVVMLVNPEVRAMASPTFGGRAEADWYINAEDIVLADAAGKPADQTKAVGADAPKTADQNKTSDKTADKTGTDAKDGGNKK